MNESDAVKQLKIKNIDQAKELHQLFEAIDIIRVINNERLVSNAMALPDPTKQMTRITDYQRDRIRDAHVELQGQTAIHMELTLLK